MKKITVQFCTQCTISHSLLYSVCPNTRFNSWTLSSERINQSCHHCL